MGEHSPVHTPSGLSTVFQLHELPWSSYSLLSNGIFGLMSIPPPNACNPAGHSHVLYASLRIFTLLQWTLQWTSTGEAVIPIYPPQGVFLVWYQVIARPLSSCGIALLSLPPGVGLTGVGLVHPSHTWWTPTHKGTPASDAMRRSSYDVGCMNVHAGLSLCTRGHLL